jgi:hypothetical protein
MSHFTKDPRWIFGFDGSSWYEVTMCNDDLLGSSPAAEKPQALWVVGLLRREVLCFIGDPFGYAFERFVYCLALGIGVSILASGIRFLVQAVTMSVS